MLTANSACMLTANKHKYQTSRYIKVKCGHGVKIRADIVKIELRALHRTQRGAVGRAVRAD